MVVGVLTFYSNNPSSNPAAVNSFYSAELFERTKMKLVIAHSLNASPLNLKTQFYCEIALLKSYVFLPLRD